MNDIIIKTTKGYRLVKRKKYVIDRNTPVGDEADFYEIKPYGGRKYIPNPIAEIDSEGRVKFSYSCFEALYTPDYKFLGNAFIANQSLLEFIANL